MVAASHLIKYLTEGNLPEFLRIAAHPIQTFTSFRASIVAIPTMQSVGHWIHTLPFAANLRVLTLLTTLPAVEPVPHHIHTFSLAAIRPRAACRTTHSRVFVTRHHGPRFLSKKPAHNPNRSGFGLATISVTIIVDKQRFIARWCGGEIGDGQGH
ncbi:hypothetical protein PVK06_015306 [Gossypium arboreum]|uniref:Uncharacterized protein n=1 Tax=Gossypium arboreum TaxID=29729 RepID=A0ABR0PWY7_GOSAR|nr:hypothetical protein PVK06_015306 [Gossypium arboreum]